MKRLMKIEGDDVGAIVKALQLDVGFPHEYMDVRFELQPDGSAEFWLNHCGALMDVEKSGERAVVMMCHRIEDPTFDATAVATNPRARMRPIHRPPRTPADRHPHCHWTIKIEPGAEPLIEEPLTLEVGKLPLANVANERPPIASPEAGTTMPALSIADFRLEHLSQGALVAALREFSLQTHLLAAAADLFLSQRHERAKVREVLANQWAGANWIAAERIASLRGLARRRHRRGGRGAGAPSGASARRERDARALGRGGSALLRLDGPHELLDEDAPGWLGLLGSGEAAPDRGDRAGGEPARARDGAARLAAS